MDKAQEEKMKEQMELAKKQFQFAVDKAYETHQTTHDKKEYTFTNVEKRRLVEQQMVELVARQAIEDIINLETLKRLGFDPNPELKILYDINLGRLIVFVPKKKES